VSLCLLGAIVVIWFAIRTVWFAFGAISPRDPGSSKPSVIFPFEAGGFATRVELFKRDDATNANVYEDYEQQIIQMAKIVTEKMNGVRDAVTQLRRFFIASLILLILFVCTAGASTLLASLLP
jgi:hypothetical protein